MMTNSTYNNSSFKMLVLLPFLGFIASGPIPYVFYGVTIDRIISIYTLSLLAVIFAIDWRAYMKHAAQSSGLALVVILYVISLLPSIIVSPDFDASVFRLLVMCSYAAIFLFAAIMVESVVGGLRIISLIAFFISSSFIITKYFTDYASYSGAYRFYLAIDYDILYSYEGASTDIAADPNITAVGSVILFMIISPLILDRRYLLKRITIAMYFLCWYVILITASRTGFTMLSIFSAVMFVNMHRLRREIGDSVVGVGLIGIAALSITALFLILTGNDLLLQILDRFTDMEASEGVQYGRFDILEEALSCTYGSLEGLVLGCGAFLLNPHNELISNLSNSGIMALGVYVILIVYTYICARRIERNGFGCVVFTDAVFLSWFFSLLTYGHTKTFWAGLFAVWCVGKLPKNVRNELGARRVEKIA